MGYQIIRQPGGRYAVHSSVTGTIVVWDAAEDELSDWYAQRAADRARRDVQQEIEDIVTGRRRQFALTWHEALQQDREHGGTASKEAAT